jgi:iron(III) transport system ATP-binding protein
MSETAQRRVWGRRGTAGATIAARLTFDSITHGYDGVPSLRGVSLVVEPGEILCLLGRSGSGKTTLLRVAAGLERPASGRVLIDDREVSGPKTFVAPEKRGVGLMFQDYALFPHLTVARNVGYGVDRARRKERVAAMLELVGLAEAAGRLPHELSGGQQQRVALARAMAPEPALVLLDEPFSNLDAALRADVRAEVRSILSAAKATAVVVTHDQEEALSLADRIAVMRDGKILQVDAPLDVYARPDERFVATFVGDADVLPGEADDTQVRTKIGALALDAPVGRGAVDVVVRPERVRLRLDSGGEGVVDDITYFGHDQLIAVRLGDGTRVRSRTGPVRELEPGDRVSVSVSGTVIAYPRAAAPSG